MRFILTLIMFVIVGATLAGALITALLAAPVSGADVENTIIWVALAGFALALPISYYLAGALLKLTESPHPKS